MFGYDDKQTKTDMDNHGILGCSVRIYGSDDDLFKCKEEGDIGNMRFYKCRYCGHNMSSYNNKEFDDNHYDGCPITSGGQE